MHRKTWLVALLGITGTAGLVALGACVGDDPAVAGSTDVGADGGAGGSETSVVGDGAGGGGDATPLDAGSNACTDASGKFTGARTYPFYGSNKAIVGTSTGGHVVVGVFRTSATYGDAAPMVGNGSTEDAAAVKFNADGSVKWQQHFGGTGSDSFGAVTVDDKDDVYVTGYFSSTSFSIGAKNFSNASGANLGVVAKLDGTTGAPVWAKSFIPGYFGFGCSAIDFDSGRLVVGCSMGQTQQYDLVSGTAVLAGSQVAGASVYGLDPATGGAVWAKALGTGSGLDAGVGNSTEIQSVDVTATGTVVAGVFGGGNLSDGIAGAISVPQVGAHPNGFVTELSTQTPALPLWAKGFGIATGAGEVVSVSAAGSSAAGGPGVVVGGSFSGTIGFGGAPHASVGFNDSFVVMLQNKAGAPAWEKYFGGAQDDTVRRVRIDPCNRPEVLFLAGSVLAPTDGVTLPAPQATGFASILCKLDPKTGALLWASGIAPGGNLDSNGIDHWDFGIDSKGLSTVVGDFRGSVDLGSGTPTTGATASTPYSVDYAP